MLPLECVKIFGAIQFTRKQKSSGDLKPFFLCIPNSKFKENKFITRFFLDQALCKYERFFFYGSSFWKDQVLCDAKSRQKE
jgi:hypothetical protein